jgi:hypothetical protein
MVDEHVDRSVEPVLSKAKRHRTFGIEGGALGFQQGEQVHRAILPEKQVLHKRTAPAATAIAAVAGQVFDNQD